MMVVQAPNQRLKSRASIVVLIVALLCSGCNGGSTPHVPVTGRVSYKGQPAVGAFVQFHPEDQEATYCPSGRVGEDGSFELTTYYPGDNDPIKGAPPGRYAVTVMLRTVSQVGDSDERDLLPTRYLNPSTSGLHAVIDNGPTDIPTFELTSR